LKNGRNGFPLVKTGGLIAYISMKTDLNSNNVVKEVLDEMDEEEFLKIIGNNSLYALLATGGIFFAAYIIATYVLPLFLSGVGTMGIMSYLSMGATIFVMMYIYRYKIFVEDKLTRAWNIAIWFVAAIVYSTVLYIGGEIIIIALLGIGILITVAILTCEFTLTSVFTWRELKEWVGWREYHAKKEAEKQNEADKEVV
jgi:hypothetical protein